MNKEIIADSSKHKLIKSGIEVFKSGSLNSQFISSRIENLDKSSLPVFDIYGKAGNSEFVNTMENIDILGYIKVPGYENCLGWVKVKGDSMSPYLNSGDYVAIKIVDRDLISWGNVYFIVTPETYILRSHNEKYEDMEIPSTSIKCFYAVRGGVIEIQ